MYNLTRIFLFQDDTVAKSFHQNVGAIEEVAKRHVNGLNKIYQQKLLKDPPNERIFFRIRKLLYIKHFANDCKNPGIVLKEFTKVRKVSTRNSVRFNFSPSS